MKIGDKIKLSPLGKELYSEQELDYGIIVDIKKNGSWDCEVDWYNNPETRMHGGYMYSFSHLELIEQNYQIY